MEETIGWLLPLLLVTSLVPGVCLQEDQRRIRTICLSVVGGILVGLSTWLLQHSVLHWAGPTLFTLDSSHQLAFQLRLTADRLPLLWLIWWWMAEAPASRGDEAKLRGLRQSALSCLLLLIVSDNLWLWYAALVTFSLLQQCLVQRKGAADFRLTGLLGCHWLGVLLLQISLGILSFDFQWQSFSELSSELSDPDAFSQFQLADLTLSTTLAVWAALLMAAVFPISVLRIEYDDRSGLQILSVLVAGTVCVSFFPLIAALQATAAHQSLLLLTLLTATLCSWQQPNRQRTIRSLGTALLMMSLPGMLIAGLSDSTWQIRALSLEHFSLALLLWSLWSRAGLSRKSRLVTGLMALLLVSANGASLMTLAMEPEIRFLPGSSSGLILGLVAGIGFGLMKLIGREFFQPETDEQDSSALGERSHALSRIQIRLTVFVGALIVVTTRLMLWKVGLPAVEMPSVEVLSGLLLGTSVALVWEYRRAKIALGPPQPSGSVRRLLETQFHLVSIWQAAIQIPGLAVSTLFNLAEVRRRNSPAGTAPSHDVTEHETPFVWELGLALASLLVLASLFLWMGE